MALTSCITPGNGSPSFEIGDDEMEIGIGIHVESGIQREKMKTVDEITEMDDPGHTRDPAIHAAACVSPKKENGLMWQKPIALGQRRPGDRVVNSMGRY